MFHLHRLEQHEELSFLDQVTDRAVGCQHLTGHRGGETSGHHLGLGLGEPGEFVERDVAAVPVHPPTHVMPMDGGDQPVAVDLEIEHIAVESMEHDRRHTSGGGHVERAVALCAVLHGDLVVAVPVHDPLVGHHRVAPAAAQTAQRGRVPATPLLGCQCGGDRRRAQTVRVDAPRPVRFDRIDEVGCGVSLEELVMSQRGDEEVTIRDQALYARPFERQRESPRGLDPGRCMGDHLGQHRVELDSDLAAGLDT